MPWMRLLWLLVLPALVVVVFVLKRFFPKLDNAANGAQRVFVIALGVGVIQGLAKFGITIPGLQDFISQLVLGVFTGLAAIGTHQTLGSPAPTRDGSS